MADDKPGAAERTQVTPNNKSDAARSTESGTLFRPSQMGVVTGTPAANTASTHSKSNASDWQMTSPSQWTQSGDAVLGIGSVLKERFVLERIVGKGGMGTVFSARDRRKEEAQDRFPYVAVKILNEDFKKHPDSLKLLQREARKAQQLAHPNIVTVYDFDRDGSNVFIVMELLQGQSLDRIIKQTNGRGMPFADVVQIVGALAQALAYAHKKNVIHSDFKPANAYVLEDGTVKILDFGIARAKQRDDLPEVEQTKFKVDDLGALTPSYASLEMLDGDDPDPRDDLYGLACVTYELLTGKHPFGRQSAKFSMDYNLKLVKPKGLSSRRWAALKHALAFKRADRTPSVEAFIAELTSDQRSSVLSWALAASAVALIGGAGYWAYLQKQAAPITAPVGAAATTAAMAAPTTTPPTTETLQPDAAQMNDQQNGEQNLTERRKEWLLQIAKANDVPTAIDVLHELRTQLPLDDVFVKETAPQAIAAANLRLADRAIQRGSYSAAADYVVAARTIYSRASGIEPRQEALDSISKLDRLLRTSNTLSIDAIRNELLSIEEDVPSSYAAIEANLAGVFADRIRRTQQTNAQLAASWIVIAKQAFGNVPAIAALNKIEPVAQPARQVEPRTVATQTETIPTQPIPEPTPLPVAQEPPKQEPPKQDTPKQDTVPKAEEKPKKKPDVIITF